MPTRLRDVPYYLFGLTVSIIVGFMFFMQVLSSMFHAHLPLPAPALMFILLPLFFFAAIACHEAGHVVAALLEKLSVQQIAVGPWLLACETEGFCLRRRDLSMKALAGFVSAVPTRADNLGRRHFVFTIGGPLVSLVIGMACLIAACILNRTSRAQPTPMLEMGWPLTAYWIPRSWTAAFLMMGALPSLEGFLLSVVPGHVSGWPNDAALLLDWKHDSRASERRWILTALGIQAAKGVPPRDWQGALIERALELRDHTPNDALANMFGHLHAFACGAFERAGELLDLALQQRAGYPAESLATLFLDAAFFESVVRRNAVAARSWLDEAINQGADRHACRRVEAGVLFAENRYAEAQTIVEQALLDSTQSSDDRRVQAEREWWNDLLAHIKKCSSKTDNDVTGDCHDFRPRRVPTSSPWRSLPPSSGHRLQTGETGGRGAGRVPRPGTGRRLAGDGRRRCPGAPSSCPVARQSGHEARWRGAEACTPPAGARRASPRRRPEA